MFLLSDYNYDLPKELIAHKPEKKRENSKLLFMNKKTGKLSHYNFFDIYNLLNPDDVLVINNTKVIPGRLYGHKKSGGKVEVLIINFADGIISEYKNGDLKEKLFECKCLIKASKPLKPDTLMFFSNDLKARVIDKKNEFYKVEFIIKGDFSELLDKIGKIPLPPYIKRNAENEEFDDKKFYQTVYASQAGAIAAPTAGLHFSSELLEKLKDRGVIIIEITLHVGYGTFLPVRVSDVREHVMHSERYFISKESASVINKAKSEKRRIIAVGTTSARTLEYSVDGNNNVVSKDGECDLFIYPGYEFKVVDALLTNFHLPQSTLLMLVSAFAGYSNIFNAYKKAIENKYRFYSYGDAMFIA